MIMIKNVRLSLRFNGSGFHGWQIQENADTVQQQLKIAVERITGENVNIIGCSRTDSGVHANMFCCNFRIDRDIDCDKLMKGLNAVLPESIGVYECENAAFDFHSRFDCRGKEYIYKIWNSKSKNPFYNKLALHYPYNLDVELLNKEAQSFVGTHDFSAFCSSGSEVQCKVRTVYACSVRREEDLVIFSVRGDGFLYNMVRIMVGTLLDINSKKIEPGSIQRIINSSDRNQSGHTAKPDGLYLNKVFYDENEVI